ncbi:MAG: hypothetical protein OXG36_03030, partial [Caldilineaceae bacterium]|nr:hypothetical protein [Caldilineaceae bacterium]
MGSWLRLLVPLVVGLALIRLYSWYKAEAAPIPPGVLIGYEDYSNAESEAEVVDLIRARVEDRVLVLFNGESLILEAEEIGLRIDTQRILQEATRYLEGDVFVRLVLRQVLGLPLEIHHVPVYYAIDFEQARAWLDAVNERHRTASRPYRLLPVDRDWLVGQGDADGSSPTADLAFMPY